MLLVDKTTLYLTKREDDPVYKIVERLIPLQEGEKYNSMFRQLYEQFDTMRREKHDIMREQVTLDKKGPFGGGGAEITTPTSVPTELSKKQRDWDQKRAKNESKKFRPPLIVPPE